MRRRLLPALLTVAALSTVSGADAQSPADGFGVTLTCTAAAPSFTLACFAERPVLEFGPVMVAVGVDAQAVLTSDPVAAHLAPYGLVVLTLPEWSAWVEVRLPDSVGVPVLGAPDWLRLGVSFGF